MRQLLVRAIITGFGLRIGSELAKFVAHRVLPEEDDNKSKDDTEEDDSLGSVSADPPNL
ncbi:hypothetical protein ENSA5_38320 [Enhygromyxa salina]|uniref:Uncharacterized protein n=1 Tax=Enhygromyxa salina TaxID=215803 RepID=A0A2S9XS04_9BACT|nr:hypothetical protein [Enhygromyxa salina]PRP95481.1 hypothetical protein ENSA5_38320 [Enhygromyxa salina]